MELDVKRDFERIRHDFNYSYEKWTYENILGQLARDPPIEFGSGLSILIVSDRCPGRAWGLNHYLSEKTKVSRIAIIHSLREYTQLEEKSYDIVIFVGMQNNKTNYEIMGKAPRHNGNAVFVMFASVDKIIENEKWQYGIPNLFNSRDNLSSFVSYLEEIRKKPALVTQYASNARHHYPAETEFGAGKTVPTYTCPLCSFWARFRTIFRFSSDKSLKTATKSRVSPGDVFSVSKNSDGVTSKYSHMAKNIGHEGFD